MNNLEGVQQIHCFRIVFCWCLRRFPCIQSRNYVRIGNQAIKTYFRSGDGPGSRPFWDGAKASAQILRKVLPSLPHGNWSMTSQSIGGSSSKSSSKKLNSDGCIAEKTMVWDQCIKNQMQTLRQMTQSDDMNMFQAMAYEVDITHINVRHHGNPIIDTHKQCSSIQIHHNGHGLNVFYDCLSLTVAITITIPIGHSIAYISHHWVWRFDDMWRVGQVQGLWSLQQLFQGFNCCARASWPRWWSMNHYCLVLLVVPSRSWICNESLVSAQDPGNQAGTPATESRQDRATKLDEIMWIDLWLPSFGCRGSLGRLQVQWITTVRRSPTTAQATLRETLCFKYIALNTDVRI